MAFNVVNNSYFDINYVNKDAEVVIVGISPGPTQTNNNLYKKGDVKGSNFNCAFSGPLRKNLCKMLNKIRINQLLKIEKCESIFTNEEAFNKVCLTSVLPYSTIKCKKEDAIVKLDSEKAINAVIANGGKYIRQISLKQIEKDEALLDNFSTFVTTCKNLNKAFCFVALGPSVNEILTKLKIDGIIKGEILPIAHPTGANGGRIKLFLTKKGEIKDKSYQNALDFRNQCDRKIDELLNR